MELTIENRRQAWNSYWLSGLVHSCLGKFVESPDSAINQFWHAQFAKLTAGKRVLDLATGNGALPKLLLNEIKNIQIDAVDLAQIAPPWLSAENQHNVRFHSGVNMEMLPFSAEEFDLVISQFGLEYANWPQALDDAARVCKHSGSFAFVMHHADSLILQLAKVELQHQQSLLASDGLLEMAKALLPKLATIQAGAAPDATAEQARKNYNDALHKVAKSIEQSDVPDLLIESREHIHTILSGRLGAELAQRISLLKSYTQAIRFAELRTTELLACALDQEKVNTLLAALRVSKPNAVMDCQVLAENEGILAWGISIY
ncbi:class I SAM-dependent methyltransferase [Rheinheimera sp. MMS21-TC3]|uniref:class I SAM-dependent methyltransferase n=1 Tax=Rheinheimera sp. MMS21-TC3 TaxID=3072790 RepID=UPI0028C4FE1D|nr:class I SAM-dependent methyltransferase [Rheinheimera sp. MMS21-TC3]WNO61971.1 class I SAM-dependent methyltransferase [Rheinheimera sp. MMS21-TC3]